MLFWPVLFINEYSSLKFSDCSNLQCHWMRWTYPYSCGHCRVPVVMWLFSNQLIVPTSQNPRGHMITFCDCHFSFSQAESIGKPEGIINGDNHDHGTLWLHRICLTMTKNAAIDCCGHITLCLKIALLSNGLPYPNYCC